MNATLRWGRAFRVAPHPCLACGDEITESMSDYCGKPPCRAARGSLVRSARAEVLRLAKACKRCQTALEPTHTGYCPPCRVAVERLHRARRRKEAKAKAEAFVQQQAMLAIVNARMKRERNQKERIARGLAPSWGPSPRVPSGYAAEERV